MPTARFTTETIDIDVVAFDSEIQELNVVADVS
jgi:hypothetical protein